MFSLVFDDDTSGSDYPPSRVPWHFNSLPSLPPPPTTLEYVINHVFSPVYHPERDDYSEKREHTLACAAHAAARAYDDYIDHVHRPHLSCTIKMLESLQALIEPTRPMKSNRVIKHKELDRDHVISQLGEMKPGDVLLFHTPYHSTTCGVMFWKQELCTLYASFHAPGYSTMASYPELAIEIPNQAFDSGDFRSKLAGFLSGKSEELPTDMLLDVGHPVEPKRIAKHVGPSYIYQRDSQGWSRSKMWFLIKVVVQSFLDRSSLGHSAYKAFILFFMCNLADHAVDTSLSSFLLHAMSAKILRRFRKLGCTAPQWLSDKVSHACTSLSRIVDERWQEVQAPQYSLPPWDASQMILADDTQLSLPHIHEYISTSLANGASDLPYTPFLPNSRFRSTLCDFLSNRDNLLSHPDDFSDHIPVALHDIERAVGEDVDDWVACVTDVDEACEQLEDLVHRYRSFAWDTYRHGKLMDYSDPDHLSGSIMLLTIIELWVALDKLVVKEISILADYSPEVPIDLLFDLLLRDAGSIHRFCRAYQYLSARYTQARPGWSALSNKFTEHSFPCRYYDSSPPLQRLKACIEDILPADPLHAKIAAFELQCPVSFDMWRSVTCWISCVGVLGEHHENAIRVRDIPELQPHMLASHRRIVSLYRAPLWDNLYYVYEGCFLPCLTHVYQLPNGSYARSGLQQHLGYTTHTSNEVLAIQANCDPSLSLHEFIAFAHLRSGGSLQWFNILRELRSRTLDFRHQEVYLLLAQASVQTGPLDSTGEFLWHQEIEDASFCHALLDELENLFIDVGVGSLNELGMAIVSLLAAVLASRSHGDVVERAIKLLQNVRRKTFGWVHELLYNLRKSPTTVDDQSLSLLRDMAAVCRSTFDVGAAASPEPFPTAQDIEIALSCAMLIRITLPVAFSDVGAYSQALLDRERRLSIILEESLRNAIQADITDLGIDRAIQLVWPGYRPSQHRWEPLQPPNSGWLVCETAQIMDMRAQMVHINLLDGSLLVDGRPIDDGLPNHVTCSSTYRELFGDHRLMVVASDLPGMDFVTTSVIYKHRVHFAVGFQLSDTFVIRAQNEDTNNIFELVPREILEDLPRSLVENHVHWLNLSTSTIEIRPIEKTWEQSSDNWTIHLQSGQSRVTKGGEFLVDKQSPTWALISSRLRCLDKPENLMITVSLVNTTQSPSSLRLSVTLPRYGLSFFVNEVGHLESHDFKDMVYDEDQYIGTLFGLAYRLILRPKRQIAADVVPKSVIVPHDFVAVASSGPLRYYVYQVDNELGCLKGTLSPESRLYLAELHALTSSGCRPDPLTGRTGVEEAISLMWLAATQQRGLSSGFPTSQSPQMHYAFTGRIQTQERDTLELELLNEDALQEAYLFPSEVTASVPLPWKGPYNLLDQLLHERSAPNLRERNRLPHNPRCHGFSSPNINPLRQLFSALRTSESAPAFQSQYISRLHDSAHYFQTTDPSGIIRRNDTRKPDTETLRKHYVQCRANYMESLDIIKMVLGPKTEFEQLLDRCGHWPRVTPFVLFRCLASTSPLELPESWKLCLISLALLALDVQRARRLLRFALDNLEEELFSELENEGCDGWDAARHPDWLLIQLQSNFLIRRVQANVAKEMMFPRSGKNTVMQVNMGEGKSSVIIPICAAALADDNQLVRVVVPKALIPQTFSLLTDRLCGLVNKPIYHLTFSRNEVRTEDRYKVKRLHRLVTECRDRRGIILMQPEHVLSLKLACVETQLIETGIGANFTPIVQKWGFEHVLHMMTSSLLKSLAENTHVSALIGGLKRWHFQPETLDNSQEIESVQPMEPGGVGTLMEIQRMVESHARDILDECDDVLRPQFQLIYAFGYQQPFEGSPSRWVTVQQILGLVKRHAHLLSTHDSHMIRCDSSSPGSFPHIHILHAEIGEQLISLIAQDALDGRLSSFGFHSEPGLRGALREFILRKDIHPDTVKMVEKYARQSTIWGPLLLLRGLLAHRILLFVLTQRRWRVDYGLDPHSPPRTMLAIPYRAKDVPAETAEFGHPDITILLTCLSYYYYGLTQEELRMSFELLLQQDNPLSDYALWVEDCGIASVPVTLRTLSGVNIRSFEQWFTDLVPLFAQNKRAIDLYLSKVVFPNHAIEFPQRISGSYWDLAEQKNHLVTGFSGTNDGQYLLPSSIDQDDPDYLHQTGTNAGVLAYLLQPENSSYMVTTNGNSERWTTLKLLRMVVAQKPQIRVLLDVGAQILDFSNFLLAKAWLDCTAATEVTGAIYFSDDDRLMVLTRNGTTEPLSSSPLVQQLDRCVAYLDDAHTRGTDLKFPLGFRAAVTLGHKVTKDRLVQGCMRMRKLGHGHSVMFFAPHEVDQRIRSLVTKENPSVQVTTADILLWAIHETWSDIQRQALYWAQQGITHQSRYESWSRFCNGQATPKQLADAWVQPELKSLADMYMPCHSRDTSLKLPGHIHERCENLGIFSLPDVRMDEEQEREVSREIEREREIERPLKASPAMHFVHPDVVQFVRTGVVPSPSWSTAFRHVFATNINNSLAASSEPHAWSAYILATSDFCETIQESESVQGRMNDYLRPVQWVLSGKMRGREALVLLSPFEADRLMPEIRISERVHLHLYIPRTAKRMKPADDLRLCSVPPVPPDWIPPWTLIDQLSVFAGQLYLSDYTSYVRLCRFLGVHAENSPHKAGMVVARNWFRNPDSSDAEIENRFEGTPLPLVMKLLAVRRGMGFAETHMGRILEGWPLAEEDFRTSEPRIIDIIE